MFYHSGQKNDAYPIGGMVGIDETPIATSLRNLRELASFRLNPRSPMILCNVIKSYMEHKPMKINPYISDLYTLNLSTVIVTMRLVLPTG